MNHPSQKVYRINLSSSDWQRAKSKPDELIKGHLPEYAPRGKSLRYRVLEQNQFETELIVFQFELVDISENNSSSQFQGDVSQFIISHLDWGAIHRPNSFSISIPSANELSKTVFYMGRYVGSFSDSDEIPLTIECHFVLRLDSNHAIQGGEIALVDKWYSSGFSPEELPQWLLRNADIYAKDVINFIPEEIQKKNRLKAQIEKYHKPFAVGVAALVSSLILILIALFFLLSTQEQLKEEQGYLYSMRSDLAGVMEINSDLRHQFDTAESQIAGRSDHTKAISQYERLLPRSVSIKQLNISAAMGGETLSHSIVATAKDNDGIVQLLKRLNAVDADQDVSLKKTSNRENGSIQFELDVKYRADL